MVTVGDRREPPADTKCPSAAQHKQAKRACNDKKSKSGYFDTGFFCPIGLFCRQISVKIVLFIIQL